MRRGRFRRFLDFQIVSWYALIAGEAAVQRVMEKSFIVAIEAHRRFKEIDDA